MAPFNAHAVTRVHPDSDRLDRTTPLAKRRRIAFVIRIRDRLGNPLGWQHRPPVTIRDSRSSIWASSEEAIAATTLMTVTQVRAIIARAEDRVGVSP